MFGGGLSGTSDKRRKVMSAKAGSRNVQGVGPASTVGVSSTKRATTKGDNIVQSFRGNTSSTTRKSRNTGMKMSETGSRM